MKFTLVLIAVLLSTAVSAQHSDSLRHYFIDKKLVQPGQLAAYDTMAASVLQSMRLILQERIDSAATKEEKQLYQQKMDMILAQKETISPWMFNNIENNDSLQTLQYYLIRTTRNNISSPGFVFTPDSTLLDSAHAVSPERLTSFLTSLQQAGFVSLKARERILRSILDKTIGDSFAVVSDVIANREMEVYFEPRKVKRFLEKLKRLGIMRQPGIDKIAAMADNYDLTSYLDILGECEKAQIIDLDDYGNYPKDYMKPVYEKASKVLPDLSFTDFAVKVEEYKEKYDTGTQHRTIVSFKNNGKIYRHSNFYSPADYDKDGKPDNEWKTGDDFEAIFNKVLRDRASPYRVHRLLFFTDYQQRKNGKIGIIALTQQQADSLQNGGYLAIQPQEFRVSITSAQIANAISQYKKIGLLSHLSTAEIDSCTKVIAEKEVNYYSDILSSFKKLVYEIDLEYGVDDAQYKTITKDIAGISKGNFSPVNIVDTYTWKNKKSFTYGFTLKGKPYSVKLTQNDDWLDTKFWQLIEKAENEQDKKGHFYMLYPSDGMCIIYLTNQQAAVLKKNKLMEMEQPEE